MRGQCVEAALQRAPRLEARKNTRRHAPNLVEVSSSRLVQRTMGQSQEEETRDDWLARLKCITAFIPQRRPLCLSSPLLSISKNDDIFISETSPI